ncbi:hypothetical protein BSFA1_79540 (plasmid) [Burkholderia sp. SFA1]|nr:hypothetical protein BYI23_E000610 [Burkholderia sp. YI23]BBQ02826.1 hypothetical protein BSFA1_79540 [Burkholderia sp. SFA1]
MESDSVYSRTHHLHIATAQSVFLHETHGVIFVAESINLDEAAELGLKLLLLYAVTADGVPIRWLTFSGHEDPQPISRILTRAWHEAVRLRGVPDRVALSHSLAHAYPDLQAKLSEINVELIMSDSKDRRCAAMLREAQRDAYKVSFWSNTTNTPVRTLADLNAMSTRWHNDLDWLRNSSSVALNRRASYEQWVAYRHRSLDRPLRDSMDWVPGKWLSGWSKIPQPPRRLFLTGGEGASKVVSEDPEIDSSVDDDAEQYVDDLAEKVGLLLKVWPNKASLVAREVGITLRELQWFVAEKADLPREIRWDLESIFGLERDEDYGFFEIEGPIVLIGTAGGPMISAYDELSHGGDLDFAVEAMPASGMADPSWRYILVQPCLGQTSVIMLARGSDAASRLDNGKFINFKGPQSIDSTLYRDIVATCGRACASPGMNRTEMRYVNQRHAEDLADIID